MQPYNESYVHQVLEETTRFYQQVKAASESSDFNTRLPLNYFWGGENMELMSRVVGSDISAQEKVEAILATDLFSHNAADENTTVLQLDWWLRHLNAAYGVTLEALPFPLQESPLCNAASTLTVGEHSISPDFLRHLTYNLQIRRHCALPDTPFNILELGAGYGGFARCMKLLSPQASHTIIDIPETLFFSAIFLRLNFPEAKVCYVSSPEALSAPLSEYDFVFVPTLFAEALAGQRFELFHNTCSLGEMKNVVIRHWMEFVQNRVEVRYFSGLNRFLNTMIPGVHDWRLEENQASLAFDARWKMLQWELEPPCTRCPYHETFVTRNLLVLAERLPEEASSAETRSAQSLQLCAAASLEDWFVYAGADNTMRLRDNILVHDLTMSGTLFKLWESIRLDSGIENVSMMLWYLYTLRRNRPFEEMFAYLDLLDTLREAQPDAEVSDGIRKLDVSRERLTPIWGYRSTPELFEEGYQGYNIVRFHNGYYALAHSLGPFDLSSAEASTLTAYGKTGQVIYDLTPALVKQKITAPRASFAGVSAVVTPVRERTVPGFDIVEHQGSYYALAHWLGEVDLNTLPQSALRNYVREGLCFVGRSREQLFKFLNESAPSLAGRSR